MSVSIQICFNPIHESFISELDLHIHQLNQSEPLFRVAILVLQAFNLDSQQYDQYQIFKCSCGKVGADISESLVHPSSNIQSLRLVQGQRLFLRKIQPPILSRYGEAHAVPSIADQTGAGEFSFALREIPSQRRNFLASEWPNGSVGQRSSAEPQSANGLARKECKRFSIYSNTSN